MNHYDYRTAISHALARGLSRMITTCTSQFTILQRLLIKS